MISPKINFHIHSNFSDGEASIKQIIRATLKSSLNYIAITDHFSNSWKARIMPTLNTHQKINIYLERISTCQDYLRESNSELTLFKGIEVDISSSDDYIRKLLHPRAFDLILFEYIETPEAIAFVKNLINYWKNKKGGKFLPIFGLAHFNPSFFMQGGLEILMQFLIDYEIYFEFNSSYSDYYSRRYEIFFKMLKDYDIPVAIGCDSHDLRRLSDIEEPLEMIQYYELEKNYMKFVDLIKKAKLN